MFLVLWLACVLSIWCVHLLAIWLTLSLVVPRNTRPRRLLRILATTSNSYFPFNRRGNRLSPHRLIAPHRFQDLAVQIHRKPNLRTTTTKVESSAMPWEQPCLQASIVESSGYLLDPCALASSARWGMALLTPSLDPYSSSEVVAYSRFLLSHGCLRRFSISPTIHCPSDTRAAEYYHPSPRIKQPSSLATTRPT